jgi:DNA-binding CsgD family transcriptional regulator/tetratricopeptide (TPR) repeat protein
MAKPIRALRSDPADPLRLFQAGAYREALETLAVRPQVRQGSDRAGAILAARAELRLNEPAAAKARLARLAQRDPTDVTVRALTGIAAFLDGEHDAGVRVLEATHREAPPGEARAEAAYWAAWAAYAQRRLDAADRWLAKALDEAKGIWFARGLALSGWIAEARADYGASARSFRLALGAVREGAERDDYLVAAILQPLASFAAEIGEPELGEYVDAHAEEFRWPADAGEHRFQTLVHRGLAALDRNDVDGALARFEEAEAIAQRPVLIAEAQLERADVYRLIGEPTAARRLLIAAARALRAADWSAAHIEDQMALLECVGLTARLDERSAGEWLMRYSALAKDDDGRYALTRDRRVQALEVHARGLAEAGLGEGGRASQVREALALWESLGYVRRALFAAADLLALGERVETGRLRALIAALPDHPLTETLRRYLGPPSIGESDAVILSPEQRRVLEALCAGVSVRDMALQWGRSEFTIRNHLKKLFAKLHVVSSAALVAKAMSTGLVGGTPTLPPRKPPRIRQDAQEG